MELHFLVFDMYWDQTSGVKNKQIKTVATAEGSSRSEILKSGIRRQQDRVPVP